MYADQSGLGLVPPGGFDESDPGLVDRLRANVDDAVDYLRARWGAFVNATPRIIDLQHRAAVFAYHAQQRGDVAGAETARDIIRKLGNINQVHGTLVDRMQQVAHVVGIGGLSSYAGLGAIPAVHVTVVTLIAAGVAWFFRAAGLEERRLELLEAGHDPSAIAMMGAGPAPLVAGLGGLARWVVLGIVAWGAYQLVQGAGGLKGLQRKSSRRRTRRNPPLVVFDTNPPGGVIGAETLAVWYEHAEDGGLYVHEFGPGVQLVAMDDGSICLEHDDAPLWAEFEVEA